MGFPRDSPRFSPYAAWRWLLFLLCHVLRFTSAADQPSSPGTGPIPRDTPEPKRIKNGPSFHERPTQGGGMKAGSDAANKQSERMKGKKGSKGRKGSNRALNFQGRGSGSAKDSSSPQDGATPNPQEEPTVPAASDIPVNCPCCGQPEPSANPLGSEGAGPSSASSEPIGDTSHPLNGNSNAGSSSSTQPPSGFSHLHSN